MSMNSLRSALGVSRDLTFEFRQQRKTSKAKKGRFDFARDPSSTNSQSLLQISDQIPDRGRAVLPPRWVDSYEGLIDDLNSLQKHRET